MKEVKPPLFALRNEASSRKRSVYKTSLKHIGKHRALEDRNDPTYLRLQGKQGHIEQCDRGQPVAVLYPGHKLATGNFSEKDPGDQVLPILTESGLEGMVKDLEVPAETKKQLRLARAISYPNKLPAKLKGKTHLKSTQTGAQARGVSCNLDDPDKSRTCETAPTLTLGLRTETKPLNKITTAKRKGGAR